MDVSDIVLTPIDTSHVKVTLTQQYQSTDYSGKVNMLPVLEKAPGDWRIVSEGGVSMPVSVSEP